MGLSGQKLLGIPIIVQHTQAEKNRAGNSMLNVVHKGNTGPMRLYVGSLHFNITEDMLRGIFEPFGKIDNIQLIMDPETGRSKGYGFLTVSYLHIFIKKEKIKAYNLHNIGCVVKIKLKSLTKILLHKMASFNYKQ
jgi:RNA-binding protein 39